MIFLTVGTQLSFDRLVRAVDVIASSIDGPIFAQTGTSNYEPRHMAWSERLRPAEFEDYLRECKLLISHAGIGSILAAQRHSKPIILFPRRAEFGEHRNDHQLATIRTLVGRTGIYVATDEPELAYLVRNAGDLVPCESSQTDREALRQRLAEFINRKQ